MTLARDGLREMLLSTLVLGGAGAVASWLALTGSAAWWIASAPLLGLWLFSLAFFRDPNRNTPAGPGLLISPADGTITEVARLDSYPGLDGPALKISIFLSVFDVHINRSPCAARVVRTDHRPGEFLDARHPECGIRNEAMTLLLDPIEAVPGPIIVRQVAGLIARRIVCRVKAGDRMERGQRFGLIKFGSRTDLIVPAEESVESQVGVGDTVRGGLTVLVRVGSAAGRGVAADARAADSAAR